MAGEFVFRAPVLADLPALANLGRTTFVETFGGLYSDEDLNAFLTDVYSESVVEQELTDPRLDYQVIDDGQQLIGYIKIGPVHVPVEFVEQVAMEVWQLYVRQSFIGQGLGTRLMQWADQQFVERNVATVYVSVFSENLRAIEFYRRQGFEKIGEYGFHVGKQIDREWIMRRVALP